MELDHGIVIADTIDLHQDPDIIYWTTRWNVTEAALREAYKKTDNLDYKVIFHAVQELGHIRPDQGIDSNT